MTVGELKKRIEELDVSDDDYVYLFRGRHLKIQLLIRQPVFQKVFVVI